MDESQNTPVKKIEIVEGHSKDLEISEVKDNLAFEIKQDDTSKKNIVIPKNQ